MWSFSAQILFLENIPNKIIHFSYITIKQKVYAHFLLHSFTSEHKTFRPIDKW